MSDDDRGMRYWAEVGQYQQQESIMETKETSHHAVPRVYAAINAVQRALAREGIEKGRKNEQQGYRFRGIDDIYNAVSPLLGEHGLCILPRVLARACTERATANGRALFYVTVEVEFDFVSSEDGSRHVVKTWGEAMDSADKATNKAMSAAYKYAVMQAFAIPTEGDNDADAKTHEVAKLETYTAEKLAKTYAVMPVFAIPTEGDSTHKVAPHTAAAKPAQSAQLQPYPAEQMAKNMPVWTEMMRAGRKTAEQIVAMVRSRYTLTPAQVEAIKDAGTQAHAHEVDPFVAEMEAAELRELEADQRGAK